jgi:hypothetical protein
VFEKDCVILRDFDSLFEEFSSKLVSRRSLIRSSWRCALEFEEILRENVELAEATKRGAEYGGRIASRLGTTRASSPSR